MISFTTTVKALVALSGGTESSLTIVVKVFVAGPWASDGVVVQRKVAYAGKMGLREGFDSGVGQLVVLDGQK